MGYCVPFGWSGLFRCLGAQRPGGPPARRGPHFSREMRRKRAGAPPLDPGFLWPLVATRWFLGPLSLVRSRGYFLRYAKTDLGRIFEGKYTGKHFCERGFPNQGTYMGHEIVQRPEQCSTTAKTSECQRAGHKPGGAGGIPPRLFASGLSLEKAWIPRPGPGGDPRRRAHPAGVPTGPPADTPGTPRLSRPPHRP